MASLSQSVHCGWNKLAKLGRCVSQVHFVKIQFGKIQFGKIQFGKILFGKYSLVKFSSENTVWKIQFGMKVCHVASSIRSNV